MYNLNVINIANIQKNFEKAKKSHHNLQYDFYEKRPNNAPMELPNGLLPLSFLLVKSKALFRLKGFGLAFSYYSPFFTLSGQGSTISQPSAWQADALPIELYPQKNGADDRAQTGNLLIGSQTI